MATAAAAAPLLLRPLFHGLLLLLLVLSLALGAHGNKPGEHYNLTRENFPPGFVFGTASSAYQVEGNTLKYGRGPCIWDTFLKYPGEIESRCMHEQHHHGIFLCLLYISSSPGLVLL
jgi:beta-glucosidase